MARPISCWPGCFKGINRFCRAVLYPIGGFGAFYPTSAYPPDYLYDSYHLRYACWGTFWRKGVGRALFTGLPYFAVYWAWEIFGGWGNAEGLGEPWAGHNRKNSPNSDPFELEVICQIATLDPSSNCFNQTF